ncbi:MAG: hypothetical protein IJ315_06270 [Firmicutes bacterium]|nr:hypothetical protein [Bacillota bacterium]
MSILREKNTENKWSEGCLECISEHNGACPYEDCAAQLYDPWGDKYPDYVFHPGGNDIPQYIEEKRKRMGELGIPSTEKQMPFVSISTILVENYRNDAGSIKKYQLGEIQYNEWNNIRNELFRYCTQLYKNQEWSNIFELHKMKESAEIYNLILQASEMIGMVNGYPLHRDSDLIFLLTAYTSPKYSEKEAKSAGSAKNKNLFNLRLEYYLARKIIEQQIKTPAMLAADNEDFRLMRRMKTKRKRQQQRKAAYVSSPSPLTIEFTSFVVRCYAFKCNKSHNIEQIRAIIDIMDASGGVIREELPAGYCKECNVYFILESDFIRLRNRGILLCQMVSSKEYENEEHTPLNGHDLKSESLLHRCGYNVGAADNLSEIQRREILRRILDNGLYSKIALLSFLDWLINQNEKVSKKDMSAALQKWSADRIFVASYNLNKQRSVVVEKIT